MNRQNAAEAIEVYKQVEHLRARLALLRRLAQLGFKPEDAK